MTTNSYFLSLQTIPNALSAGRNLTFATMSEFAAASESLKFCAWAGPYKPCKNNFSFPLLVRGKTKVAYAILIHPEKNSMLVQNF